MLNKVRKVLLELEKRVDAKPIIWIDIENESGFTPELQKMLGNNVSKKIIDKLADLSSKWNPYEDVPESYYKGVNVLQNYIVKELNKVGFKCEAGEGDDAMIEIIPF